MPSLIRAALKLIRRPSRCPVNGREDLDRLNLDDRLVLDNQLSAEPDVDPNRPVDDRDWLLAHRSESTLSSS